eukprot:gb/GEZN01002569.1/.p1 GENE.gb/GEZN01002569.1/~~gb/GEZN01002569.1/.p1  ORF type:complete len:719 (+),score=97.26 gb/GEZN01002569.1/:289-2157(+)
MSQPKYLNELPTPASIKLECGSYLDMEMREGTQDMGIKHPYSGRKLKTTVWSYTRPGQEPSSPAPTLIVDKGKDYRCPVDIRFKNKLGFDHFLGIDRTVSCCTSSLDGVPCRSKRGSDIRTVVHLHGSNTNSQWDGNPEAWYTDTYADGTIDTGKLFFSDINHYENDQPATNLFYHDHAMGITRLNVYMGLVGLYLIEDNEKSQMGLPSGDYDIPLAFQDFKFELKDGKAERFYTFNEQDSCCRALPPNGIEAEVYGDIMTVNGKVWPKKKVLPTMYRFRLLNGCDSRYLRIAFWSPKGRAFLPFFVVGSDQSLLMSPVLVKDLLVGPGERYEIVVDFKGFAGESLILTNSEPTAVGPVKWDIDGQWMRFDVEEGKRSSGYSDKKPDWNLPDPVHNILKYVVNVRQIILTEMDQQPAGYPGVRVRPMIGTPDFVDGLPYMAPETEIPMEKTAEVWEFINISPDQHPMHIHLVRFKILNRQAFSERSRRAYAQTKRLEFIEAPKPPEDHENGLKDTVVVPSGHVVRIAMVFEKAGPYVYHCHILSHEDNEMMRPYLVVPYGLNEDQMKAKVERFMASYDLEAYTGPQPNCNAPSFNNVGDDMRHFNDANTGVTSALFFNDNRG